MPEQPEAVFLCPQKNMRALKTACYNINTGRKLIICRDAENSVSGVCYSERKKIFSFTGADMHGVTAGNGCARQY